MAAGYFDKPIRFASGLIAASAAIEVRDTGGVLADIYTDAGLSVAKTNPGTVDADGRFIFYAAYGEYDVTVGVGPSAATYRIALVANTDLTFDGRAELVTWWTANSGDVPSGAILSDGTVSYVKDGGASISDLSGLSPYGDVYPDHFAGNTTPGTTDMTVAINSAISYVIASNPGISTTVDTGGGAVNFRGMYLISSTIGVVGNNITLRGVGKTASQIIASHLSGVAVKFGDENSATTHNAVIQNMSINVPPNTVRTSGAHVQFRNVTGGGSFNVDYNGFYGGIEVIGSAHLFVSNSWFRGRNRNGDGVTNNAAYCVRTGYDTVTGRGVTGLYLDGIDGVANNNYNTANDNLGWVDDFLLINAADGVYVSNFHANLAGWAVTIEPTNNAFMGEVTINHFYMDKAAFGNARIIGGTTQDMRTISFRDGLMRAAGGGNVDEITPTASSLYVAPSSNAINLITLSGVRFDAPRGAAITMDQTLGTIDRIEIDSCFFEDVNEADNVLAAELLLSAVQVRVDNLTFLRGSTSTTYNIDLVGSVTRANIGALVTENSSVSGRPVADLSPVVYQSSGSFGSNHLNAFDDWDALTDNTAMVNNSAGTTGAPTAGTNWQGITLSQADGAVRTQLAFRPDDFRIRRYGSGAWGGWSEVYHQKSVLGTVSQSGGDPTGAVIERGSNANGEYVRYADGTQICWKKVTLTAQNINTAYGSLFNSASLLSGATAYPVSFIAAPSCTITAHVEGLTAFTVVGGSGDINNTPSTVYAVTTTSVTNRIIHVNVQAIGRWF